jgi:hypothetical protein
VGTLTDVGMETILGIYRAMGTAVVVVTAMVVGTRRVVGTRKEVMKVDTDVIVDGMILAGEHGMGRDDGVGIGDVGTCFIPSDLRTGSRTRKKGKQIKRRRHSGTHRRQHLSIARSRPHLPAAKFGANPLIARD